MTQREKRTLINDFINHRLVQAGIYGGTTIDEKVILTFQGEDNKLRQLVISSKFIPARMGAELEITSTKQ